MLAEVDDKAGAFVNDYDCHLFSIVDATELPKFRTELNELLQVLRLRNNGISFNDLVTNNKAYQNIDKDTAIMMSELASVKLPRKTKEGGYNMCKAVMEIAEQNKELGREEGRKEGARDTQKMIVENMLREGMSIENAARYSGCDIETVKEIQESMFVNK